MGSMNHISFTSNIPVNNPEMPAVITGFMSIPTKKVVNVPASKNPPLKGEDRAIFCAFHLESVARRTVS